MASRLQIVDDHITGSRTLLTADKRILQKRIYGTDRVLGEWVVRRGDDDEFIIPADFGYQILIAYRALNNTDIDLVALNHMEHPISVGDMQAHSDIGKLGLIFAKNARDNVLTDRRTRSKNKRAQHITGQLSDLVIHFTIKREDLIGIALHKMTGRGETDPVVGAIKQPCIEVVLQLANLECDGRLGHVQRFCCFGETKQAGYRCKYLKPSVRHEFTPRLVSITLSQSVSF